MLHDQASAERAPNAQPQPGPFVFGAAGPARTGQQLPMTGAPALRPPALRPSTPAGAPAPSSASLKAQTVSSSLSLMLQQRGKFWSPLKYHHAVKFPASMQA